MEPKYYCGVFFLPREIIHRILPCPSLLFRNLNLKNIVYLTKDYKVTGILLTFWIILLWKRFCLNWTWVRYEVKSPSLYLHCFFWWGKPKGRLEGGLCQAGRKMEPKPRCLRSRWWADSSRRHSSGQTWHTTGYQEVSKASMVGPRDLAGGSVQCIGSKLMCRTLWDFWKSLRGTLQETGILESRWVGTHWGHVSIHTDVLICTVRPVMFQSFHSFPQYLSSAFSLLQGAPLKSRDPLICTRLPWSSSSSCKSQRAFYLYFSPLDT